MTEPQSANPPDVLLVGAGVMCATLAELLKELDPGLKIEIYEVLGGEAQESSNAWNNAGAGHAALCETSRVQWRCACSAPAPTANTPIARHSRTPQQNGYSNSPSPTGYRLPSLRLAEAKVAGGVPAHLYELTWPAPASGGALAIGQGQGKEIKMATGTCAAKLKPGQIIPPFSLTAADCAGDAIYAAREKIEDRGAEMANQAKRGEAEFIIIRIRA